MIAAGAKLGAALTAGLLVLAGCSSDSSDRGLMRDIAGNLATTLKSKTGGRPPVVTMSAEKLATINAAVLQVNPLRFGGSNFLTRITRRNDSRGGIVDVWQSTDKAQIVLNNGVLVGTRGVGSDIIASIAPGTINAVMNTRSGSGRRSYEVSDGDSTATKLTLDCTWHVAGPAQISVTGQAFSTTHMVEICSDHSDKSDQIENHFWVQSDGTVRKSQQWAGPAVGYFELILLKG
ncbi:MAG: YjbF family lipoprotein [Sulfitobacter sp.]